MYSMKDVPIPEKTNSKSVMIGIRTYMQKWFLWCFVCLLCFLFLSDCSFCSKHSWLPGKAEFSREFVARKAISRATAAVVPEQQLYAATS